MSLLTTLQSAESFIRGFEDDEMQEGIPQILAGLRAEIAKHPPTAFQYDRWRHGGWYVCNVRYPSGAIGCVSRNYEDRKWRIACDPRPFDERPTFKDRDAAALAEWHLAEAEWERVRSAAGDMFRALDRIAPMLAKLPSDKYGFEAKLADNALAKATGRRARVGG